MRNSKSGTADFLWSDISSVSNVNVASAADKKQPALNRVLPPGEDDTLNTTAAYVQSRLHAVIKF